MRSTTTLTIRVGGCGMTIAQRSPASFAGVPYSGPLYPRSASASGCSAPCVAAAPSSTASGLVAIIFSTWPVTDVSVRA